MGPETYETLCDKIAPDNPRTKTYPVIVDTLEQHFDPRPLEISENFRFKCRRQGDKNATSPDETIDEYLVALRRIAVTCNFGNYLNTALRSQLVFGLKRNYIRGRLVERRDLTMNDARDIAVSMELSQKGAAEIAGTISKSEVNAVQHLRDVEYRGVRINLPLYVVNSSKHPLLGREWLKVLNVYWNVILKKPDPVNVIDRAIGYCNTDECLKQIFVKYATVFEDSIGKISTVQAKLHLKPNVQSVFLKARKIPFNLRAIVDKELNKLESEGVLTKVNYSSWATPIVLTVNPYLKVDQHPLPTIDELFASLAGGQKFTKYDLVQAYLQMEVAEEDRAILTLNTHRGLYRPNHLMYGVSSTPAIWQRQIETILKGIEGVDAILNMPRPKNKDEVRSLVGLVNYYGRFYENLSTLLYPLNNWTKNCERSFETVKERMQKDNCLLHYSSDLPLVLATDASPYGVGAVLSHIFPNGIERPIQFASQTLNRTQQRYMQIDKEAYAIVLGVKKFFQYLYGRKFVLITENQAISKIFSESKGLPVMSALRMQHYATYLQSFDYEIRFRKSADHANADALSRMPLKRMDPENVIEESDVVEINQIDTLPLTAAELSEATAADKSPFIQWQVEYN
ncbi:uncharacterized protein LOC135697359 [Ochlerotatus camptorhynchus]|uniref:uncharacterized protein LOC135697359 n=1 Tax=Ochlerotatus camptorhynchus TaxID=644619 RepID=UPI0031D53DD3